MATGIGRRGRGPSEVTCRIGGDRPGCDFMVTTLGKWRADTGTSTGRLMLAVLGGPMWSATLSAPVSLHFVLSSSHHLIRRPSTSVPEFASLSAGKIFPRINIVSSRDNSGI